jgi:hypothetical protein
VARRVYAAVRTSETPPGPPDDFPACAYATWAAGPVTLYRRFAQVRA